MRKVMIFLPDLISGGGQKIAVEIIKHISSPEVQFQILCLGARQNTLLEAELDKLGMDVVFLGKKRGFSPNIISKIYKAIKQFSPDVVHVHLPRLHYILLPVILAKVPIRYYTVHNIAHLEHCNILIKILMGIAFHLFKFVPVAISDCCLKSASSFYRYPISKIPCIYNGVNVKQFTKPANIERKDDLIKFIAVGRLEDSKGFRVMLKSFLQVYKTTPNIRLTILGEGELRAEMEEFCRVNNIANAVSMLGNVKNVKEHMWQSDIYLMTSKYEGLPIAILEAMAAGLPIITTKAGGVIDIVKHNINGLLCEVESENDITNAMLSLVTNEELRAQFSKSSLSMVPNFDISICANSYLELYLK